MLRILVRKNKLPTFSHQRRAHLPHHLGSKPGEDRDIGTSGGSVQDQWRISGVPVEYQQRISRGSAEDQQRISRGLAEDQHMYQESVNVLQQLFRFGTDGVTTVGTADVFAHVNGCREQNNVEVYEYIRQVPLKCRLQQPSTTFNNLQQPSTTHVQTGTPKRWPL